MDASVRILHLRVANFYGGPERQLHLHAREALGGAYEVEIATLAPAGHPPPWLEPIAADGIPTLVIPSASSYDPGAIAALRRVLRTQGTDILCTHDYRSTLIAPFALRGTRARWVAFSRGSTRDDVKVRGYQLLETVFIRMARRVVAVSRAQGRKLESALVPPSRIAVVPNAVDTALLAETAAVDLRARLGFSTEDVVCVSGGRFSAEKGQADLVEAAAIALGSEPRLRFVLFGEGPDLDAVRGRVRARGLEGRIRCPGFERDMVGCLKGADLLINPSLSEGLPNIVLESMAVGTTVVATDVGGVPELIEDGRTGYLVPPSDPGRLALRILDAAAALPHAAAMVAAAREKLATCHTFRHQYRVLSRVYDDVLLGGGQARLAAVRSPSVEGP